MTSPQYFNRDPPFFSYWNKDNTHTNIIYKFFKISRVSFFLNRNLVRKVAFFPIYFVQKRLYWTHILIEITPPFTITYLSSKRPKNFLCHIENFLSKWILQTWAKSSIVLILFCIIKYFRISSNLKLHVYLICYDNTVAEYVFQSIV